MEEILNVFSMIFTLKGLAFICLGVVMGLVFGCIPGLSTPIALALILPITFVLDQTSVICLIMGIYAGGISGGLVSAITLKIPGSSAAVATTFDGYPLAQQGRAVEALSVGVCSSGFGGLFSCLCLIICAPLLSKISIGFGPWELFGTTVLALSFSCSLIKGNMVKGFISMALGLLFACVGLSPIDGMATRFTAGNIYLENGVEMITLVIGIFALPEVLSNAGRLKEKVTPVKVKRKLFYLIPLKQIPKYIGTWLRCSLLGTIAGILPGMGGGAACLMSYAMEKGISKNEDSFGKGNPIGVAAPEAGNNATMGGALIPMLSLGIPGDTNTSIIMGALTMQGIAVGPLLMQNSPIVYREILFAALVANILMILIMAFLVPYMAKIVIVPKQYLLPLVTVFCVTGVYSLNNVAFDVYMMFGLLFLGYIMVNNNYPVAPMIVAFVLGPYTESGLRRSIQYYGTFGGCLQRMTVGTFFLILAAVIPVIIIISHRRKIKKAAGTAADEENGSAVGMND